jgi:hypothetical protein
LRCLSKARERKSAAEEIFAILARRWVEFGHLLENFSCSLEQTFGQK